MTGPESMMVSDERATIIGGQRGQWQWPNGRRGTHQVTSARHTQSHTARYCYHTDLLNASTHTVRCTVCTPQKEPTLCMALSTQMSDNESGNKLQWSAIEQGKITQNVIMI